MEDFTIYGGLNDRAKTCTEYPNNPIFMDLVASGVCRPNRDQTIRVVNVCPSAGRVGRCETPNNDGTKLVHTYTLARDTTVDDAITRCVAEQGTWFPN